MAIKAFELFGEISLKGDKTTLTGLKNISIQVNTTEKDLKKLHDQIEKTSKGFGSNFQQGFLSSFGIQRGSGIGSLLGSGAGNLLTSGVKALYGHVTDAMDRGLDFADQIQKWKFAFTSMAGDETKGLTHLMELMKYGKDSAFETTDVINFAQQLEAVKVKGKEVIPMLEGIGGALAKSGKFSHEALEGSILAITQILSKGQVSAEEMQRQLSQYIPNPYGFAARGLNRLGYRDDSGGEFTDATVRKYAEEKRFNPDAFVRILTDQFREESKGLLEKFVSGSISGTQAQLDDTKLFLFAQSMLGGGDMLGTPGGAYAQRLQNLKTQIGLYSGPEAQKIGKNLGNTAEMYYGVVGGLEERMFQSDWFTDLLHGDPEGAKQKLHMLGSFIPEGLKNGVMEGSKMVVDAASSAMGSDVWNALTDFWETKSPSKKAERMGEWIAEGLEMGLNKKQAGNYANLQRLSQQSPDFMRKLGETAARLGTNPDYLLNVFARESSLNPNAYNPSGGTGLFQLMPMHANKLGLPGGPNNKDTFRRAVQSLGAEGQLDLFYRYITEIVGVQNFKDQASAYASVFMPKYVNASPDSVVARSGTRNYSQNTGLDRNKDGVITKRELGLEAEGALGAGKFFSVNGSPIAKSNPMPVEIVGGSTIYVDPNYRDQGLSNQIAAAQNAYASRRLQRPGSAGTINDPVAVDGGTVYAEQQPLKTSMIMLTESALNLKKPLDLLGDSATTAAGSLGMTKEQLEAEFGAAITDIKKKKKRDKLFDSAFTREGEAADFQGGLQGLLGNLGWENTSSLGKQALFGFIRDAQGRLAHDFSSMITEALFGHRKGGEGADANELTGGLFGGGGFNLGSIFSKLFGGFRAGGGGMSAGRFYVAGEHGPEIITGPGYVHNNRETRAMMSGGGGDTHVFFALGDRAVADLNDQWVASRRAMRKMIKIQGRYGRAFQV